MPDISMCDGAGCPKKETCYRFTATPCEYWQAFFATPPVVDGECSYYWENRMSKESDVQECDATAAKSTNKSLVNKTITQ